MCFRVLTLSVLALAAATLQAQTDTARTTLPPPVMVAIHFNADGADTIVVPARVHVHHPTAASALSPADVRWLVELAGFGLCSTQWDTTRLCALYRNCLPGLTLELRLAGPGGSCTDAIQYHHRLPDDPLPTMPRADADTANFFVLHVFEEQLERDPPVMVVDTALVAAVVDPDPPPPAAGAPPERPATIAGQARMGTITSDTSSTEASIVPDAVQEGTPAPLALVSEVTLRIFPVPANGLVTVTAPATAGTLAIRDAGGRTVHTQPMTERAELDVSSWPTGLYTVTIWTAERSMSGRMIVE